ncbi:MAG TPA: cobyrinate a,c-diamide synthase [Actinocrinis sp.]|nr:cobyrinate a,c-diamide synthase [Actinocrinis sp.]HXR72090.1 cobyrinate a,c-diamide synthase [Actinocrinis sp.]
MIPRIVIAAPASGHGKTTVATGLIAAFARAGLSIAPFKVGPDYIDPGYHALAAGKPGRNLDPFLVGEERVRDLFAHGSRGADLAVVEGVMGLYDGAVGRAQFASTAHVAHLIDAPVILVVDATAQGRSVAALVHGFRSFDPALRIAGVILNRVGSDRHRAILTEALDEIGVPVLGSLHRSAAVAAPSRHLGLVPVAERAPESVASVDALAELVKGSIDLAAVERIARAAAALPERDWSPRQAVAQSAGERGDEAAAAPVVAIASGAAFTFSYAEHAELLAAAGAQVVPFDPLHDEKLPDETSALVIGGGFPEIYAPELSANGALRAAVRELAEGGGVIAAECAGLLYLAESLDGAAMCGLLPAAATMTKQLTLGYREAIAPEDNLLCDAGTRVAGHEFHRTKLEPAAGGTPAWLWAPDRVAGSKVAEGYAQGRVHASYLHLHWAGTPSIATRIVREAAAWTP